MAVRPDEGTTAQKKVAGGILKLKTIFKNQQREFKVSATNQKTGENDSGRENSRSRNKYQNAMSFSVHLPLGEPNPGLSGRHQDLGPLAQILRGTDCLRGIDFHGR